MAPKILGKFLNMIWKTYLKLLNMFLSTTNK
jgi:hypothetical protein